MILHIAFFEAVVYTHCARDKWASCTSNQVKMTHMVPAACFATRPEPGGEMGRWAGGTKGRRKKRGRAAEEERVGLSNEAEE